MDFVDSGAIRIFVRPFSLLEEVTKWKMLRLKKKYLLVRGSNVKQIFFEMGSCKRLRKRYNITKYYHPVMITEKEKIEIERMRFVSEIQSEIASLDFQRDRIMQPQNFQHNEVKPTHDADFYMVLLRRLYRRIEEAQHDSRVANMKGKFSNLHKKVKIRDHFEHEVDFNNFPQYAPGIVIVGGLVINGDQSHIVSGDRKWFLFADHDQFKKLLVNFLNFYPFTVKAEKQQSFWCKLFKSICK